MIAMGAQRASSQRVTSPPAVGHRLRAVLVDPRAVFLAAIFALLLVTNAGFSRAPAGDALDYRRIALAAPGFPTEPVGSAYTARFFIHYLVGVLSKVTGFSVDRTYDIVLLVVIAAILAVVYNLLRGLAVPDFAVCASLFVFNPYTLRPYMLQTGCVQDLVFVLGLAICMLGLRHQSRAQIVSGLLVAVLGRQTAVAVAPVAALWVLWGPSRRPVPTQSESRSTRWATAAVVLLVTVGVLAAVKRLTMSFTEYYEPSLLHNSVFNRLNDLPGAGSELISHFLRLGLPLAVPLAALIGLITVVGWRSVPPACWASLAIVAAIVAQPSVTDPAFAGFQGNEQRLVALSVLPLVCAVADLFCVLRDRPHRRINVVVILGVLAVASVNHKSTAVGPHSLHQFLVLEGLAAIVVAALITRARLRPNQPDTPTEI